MGVGRRPLMFRTISSELNIPRTIDPKVTFCNVLHRRCDTTRSAYTIGVMNDDFDHDMDPQASLRQRPPK